jgi:DNA-binding NarL/FixJ family response regulator
VAQLQVRASAAHAHGGRGSIRVALGEENFLAREGITALLSGLEGIELVASCGDIDTLRAAIEQTRPDVVLTDAQLPPGHTDEGVRLAAELRSAHPRVGVVVLSKHAERVDAATLFAEGSYRRAYLLKERLEDSNELARAIREVAGGGAVVDPRIIDELLSRPNPTERSLLDALTRRQFEILGLIAEGHSNKAIADRLSISKRGVERHVNSIFAQLDLGDPADVSRRVRAALLYLAAERSLGDGE